MADRLNTVRGAVNRILPKGRFGRSVAVLMGGTALGQLIVVATTPIITRLYTPEDLGLATTFLSLIVILGAAGSLRYEFTIPLPQDELTGAGLLAMALLLVVIYSAILSLIIFLFGPSLALFLNIPEIESYLWLLPVGILGMGFYQALNYWAVRRKAFGKIAQTKITQNVGQITIQIVAGLVQTGPIGLIIGYITGQAGGVGVLGRLVWRDSYAALSGVNLTLMRQAAIRYKAFAIYATPSAILNATGLRLAVLLIASLFGLQVAGWFAFADRLTNLPSFLMATTIGQTFMAEAVTLVHRDPYKLRRLYYRLARHLALLGVMLAVPIIVLSPLLLGAIFGTQWHDAVPYLQAQAAAMIMQLIASPINLLGVFERPQIKLAWDVSRVVSIYAVLSLCAILRTTPEVAIIIYSAVFSCFYALLFVMNAVILQKRVAAYSKNGILTTEG